MTSSDGASSVKEIFWKIFQSISEDTEDPSKVAARNGIPGFPD